MRFSVVINTYNRADSLRKTLESLRQQTHRDFEVVVVNGPSTDDTEALLAEYAGKVRSYLCPRVQLSISRNIGVSAAAGDVVAFIDDDSIATPRWLEELAAAYEEPGVCAAGGLVYDPTGVSLQYRFSASHRDGRVENWVELPLDQYLQPGADPAAYLQGTNMSFSRAVLQEIDGFDENIRYIYDDVETCMQAIDRGYKLKPVDGEAVLHKFLPSHIRNNKKVMLDPYNWMCDRIYFTLRNGSGKYPIVQLLDVIVSEAKGMRRLADQHTANGDMTPEQRDWHHQRVDAALEVGLAGGFELARGGVSIPDADPNQFLPFPVYQPAATRLKLCFISREYPPGDFGGPGRYSHELAAGFASAGHEVHVVCRSRDIYSQGLEDGVWVHRIPDPDRYVPEMDGVLAKPHVAFMASTYHEVCRIHEAGPLDFVSAPLWLCDGLACTFDTRFPTATTLITAMKAVSGMAEWAKPPEFKQLVAPEEELVAQSQYLHAVSQPILKRAIEDYRADPDRSFVANLGLRDFATSYSRKRPEDGKVRVLYAGRMETRKGLDILLEAAPILCREFPEVEFVLVGKDVPMLEGGTHRERFQTNFAGDPEVSSRVRFTGHATEDELFQHYADADVVCIPSRYESFGLVFVEAMIFAKPVIGSRAGGMVEVVADGEQGYLIPPGDGAALIDCLRKLIADPDLRARVGKRSRELYEQRFSIAVTVDKCEAEFRKVMAKHAATRGTDPKAPAPREDVSRQLAETFTRALGMQEGQAKTAADRLLDPVHHPLDYVQQFRRFWKAPADEFERSTIHVLFGSEVPHEEVAGWHVTGQSIEARLSMVRQLVKTAPAQKRFIREAWLDQLQASCQAEQPPVVEPVRYRHRLRHSLSRTKYIGQVLKYGRRSLLMPVYIFRIFKAVNELKHLAHRPLEQLGTMNQNWQPTERNDGSETLLKELLVRQMELLARQLEMRTLVQEQNDRITHVMETMTSNVRNGEFPQLSTKEVKTKKAA